MAPIAGILSRFLDPRVMMMVGFGAFAGGTWMMSSMTADWDFYELLLPQILRGVGLMLSMVPINNVALGTLPRERIAGASGLYNLTRNLGGAVGLAVINTILTNRTTVHFARLAEQVNWGKPEAMSMLNSLTTKYDAAGFDGNSVAIKKMAGMVQQQSYVLSFIDVFVLLTMLFASLVIFAMMIAKPQPLAAGAGGGH
jgi:DHA2 family multidrug resistance protein